MLSYNQKELNAGDKVYQIAVTNNKPQLMEYTVHLLLNDKQIIIQNKDNKYWVVNANAVHTNKEELLLSWMESLYLSIQKHLPQQLHELVKIFEQLGFNLPKRYSLYSNHIAQEL